MGFPSKRVAVDDAPAVEVLGNYEGPGTLVNRGPDTVYLAETQAGATAGASITDDSVESFALKVDEGLPIQGGGRQDELWAICAAAETATLHFIAEN